MPLVKGGVTVPFDAESAKLIAESNKVIAQLNRVKETTKANNAAMAQAAKQAESAAKKSTSSWTEFRSAYSTVLDAVRVGQAVWDEFGQKFVDNAVTVGNMARSLGTTTEEASRLKEVADDTGIGIDKLTSSMKLAQKDGFQPNIEGLAQMADEYNALAPGVERTQFLLDRFGKSGEEMGKLLEKGGDSIRNMAAAMDEGMIVTEEAYEQARQYQISVDALKDSWDAFTYQAAPPLVNAMSKVVNDMRDWQRANELAKEDGETLFLLSGKKYQAYIDEAAAERETADAMLLAKEASEEAAGAFESEADKAAQLRDEAQEAAAAIREMTKANQDTLSLIGDLTDSQARYAEEIEKVNQDYADGNITLEEREQKLGELADAQELASRRMILSMLEQQLAIDGLDARETEYLLQTGLKWGIYTEEAVAAARAAQDEILALTNALNNLPTEKTITITTIGATVSGGGGANQIQNYYAEGGSFIIPKQYGYENFNMGGIAAASGGEMVTVTPEDEIGKRSSNTVINISISGDVSDPERMAYRLGPAVERVLRQKGVMQ